MEERKAMFVSMAETRLYRIASVVEEFLRRTNMIEVGEPERLFQGQLMPISRQDMLS